MEDLGCFVDWQKIYADRRLRTTGIDDAQSLLGYILSNKLYFRILFSSESYAHSVTGVF